LSAPINILVCILDWGLGHATRCIPLIRHLQELNCRVLIAGNGRSLRLLKEEFPACEFINLPSYRFIYPSGANMALAMMASLPSITSGIYYEHKQLKKIIADYDIHGVISDNRFGLWNKKIPCVYMTHQVRIRGSKGFRFVEPLLFKVHSWFIRKFDFLWIPDLASEENLSGKLSHPADEFHAVYLGPLSRFQSLKIDADLSTVTEKPDILAIISGPEPQRTIFESMVLEQASNSKQRVTIIRGIPGGNRNTESRKKVRLYDHLDTATLAWLIKNSQIVLSRPGYSTIMDLAVLGARAFFVPTPGQTEQEYLAALLKSRKLCNYSSQKEFRLENIFQESEDYPGLGGFSGSGNSFAQVRNFVEFISSKFKIS